MSSQTTAVLKRLQRRLPQGELRLEPEVLQRYSGDKWFATALPQAVALPASANSVATIMKFATRHRIPVTPRGAGYGYVGGCVPLRGGIVLSLEKLNRIKEINPDDFVAVVEPGVKTASLQGTGKEASCENIFQRAQRGGHGVETDAKCGTKRWQRK